jgi:pectinesterase
VIFFRSIIRTIPWIPFLGILSLNAQVFDMLVAQEDEGAYRTIQSAIDRIPDNSGERYLVFIKNGKYQEKVVLPSSKTNVSLIGESLEGVSIEWNDYEGKNGMSGADSYTFLAEAPDLYMENITIRNTTGSGSQAVAIRTTGERQVFNRCVFDGHQDTYYAHKNRQYNLNCLIRGNTDFIYGDATAVFDSCIVLCLTGGQYITAPADTKLTSQLPEGGTFLHGLLFRLCSITRESGVTDNSYYLGRPWQPDASSVYINCMLDSHIRPEGWSTWSSNNHLSSFFAEYNSMDMVGNPVDTNSRVDWSYQLSDEWVNNYYTLEYFLKKNDVIWDPVPVTMALAAPEDLTGELFNLSWTGVAEAIGYTIIRNDTTIGFSVSPDFTDATATHSIENIYRVKSVSENGNLSKASQAFYHAPLSIEPRVRNPDEFDLSIKDKHITFERYYNIKIYSLSGHLLLSRMHVSELSLNPYTRGIYILVAENNQGIIHIRHIYLE